MDIQTTEFGYYLLAEIIGMKDRELAGRIELAIWPNSPTPDKIMLDKFVSAIQLSEGPEEFSDMARKILGE